MGRKAYCDEAEENERWLMGGTLGEPILHEASPISRHQLGWIAKAPSQLQVVEKLSTGHKGPARGSSLWHIEEGGKDLINQTEGSIVPLSFCIFSLSVVVGYEVIDMGGLCFKGVMFSGKWPKIVEALSLPSMGIGCNFKLR